MYVQKFTLNYTRTINLGNYSQIKLSLMPTVHLDAGDDEAEVLEAVWEMCRANIEHAAQPIVKGYKVGDIHGISQEELFLGLPIETVIIEEDDNANQESN